MSYPKPMKYVTLGRSGLKVSKIILGCMSYGSPKWQPWILGDEEVAFEHIKYAYDSGINTFDTANVYSGGISETILGKAIRKLNIPREDVVIMTKVFFPVERDLKWPVPSPDDTGYVNQHGLSRKHIFESVKASLKRLDMEYIDVLQCHRFDYNTPIEETMQALHDVVKAGYVRYIGMSSCWAWQFHAMQSYAISHSLTPFISMQNHYNLIYREEEREMMPTLKHFGVASIPWSPIARGMLARPWKASTNRAESDGFQQNYQKIASAESIINRVEELAKKKNCKMAQIAVAWTLAKGTAPIIGTTKLENLKEAIDALKVELSDQDMEYLEASYLPTAVLGHS